MARTGRSIIGCGCVIALVVLSCCGEHTTPFLFVTKTSVSVSKFAMGGSRVCAVLFYGGSNTIQRKFYLGERRAC
jgi:hypothetical protein